MGFKPVENGNNKVFKAQLALVVDFSKSAEACLQGLTSNYWEMYNTFSERYPNAKLEIALVGYARRGFGPKNNYVKVISDFGDDPSKIFEYLYNNLTGSSISENKVGNALKVAIHDLHWGYGKNTVKTIITIGNGPIKDNYSLAKKMCNKSKKLGIKINSLYILFKKNDKNFGYWMTLTKMSGGHLKTIVSNYLIGGSTRGSYENQLKIIQENPILNSSYIPYGIHGEKFYERSLLIDSLCKETGVNTFFERVLFKTSSIHQQTLLKWDLVTYFGVYGKEGVQKLGPGVWPKSLQHFTEDQFYTLLKSKYEERKMSYHIIEMMQQANIQLEQAKPAAPAYTYNICKTVINMLFEYGI